MEVVEYHGNLRCVARTIETRKFLKLTGDISEKVKYSTCHFTDLGQNAFCNYFMHPLHGCFQVFFSATSQTNFKAQLTRFLYRQ